MTEFRADRTYGKTTNMYFIWPFLPIVRLLNLNNAYFNYLLLFGSFQRSEKGCPPNFGYSQKITCLHAKLPISLSELAHYFCRKGTLLVQRVLFLKISKLQQNRHYFRFYIFTQVSWKTTVLMIKGIHSLWSI